ncbi:MAG: chemotaxis protein CheA [Spirochaetales bacterium]|nr:chemotaxis protein CheA [Spirochaetales bacterium]
MKAAFREEASELLAELENSLLELEGDSANHELIDRVFRAMHTLKGSGAMFGFEEIADFAHEVENVLDLARNDRLPVTKELIDLNLAARDQILDMLATSDGGAPATREKNDRIVSQLQKLSLDARMEGAPESVASEAADASDGTQADSGDRELYRIRFRPAAEIFLFGTNPVLLLKELAELGDCEAMAHTAEIPGLDEINPEHCYTYWDIMLTTDRGMNAVRDVFVFVEDDSELEIEVLADLDAVDEDITQKKLGQILLERGDIDEENLRRILSSKKLLGQVLVEEGLGEAEAVKSALHEQREVKRAEEARQSASSASSIRVRSDKLDALVNLVGELVTVQAHLSQTTGELGNGELVSTAEEVERLTAELRDTAMSLRMVPIGSMFGKFRRLVRDLSGQLGKEVELITEGDDTELDKSVIERLSDPLVHLVRNCIDHGIESPDVRAKHHKERAGTIILSAEHSGAQVLIQITDDGAGLNSREILTKAVARGLVSPQDELSEKEIFDLVLAPGFSTAQEVTDVSGRGVGMDVVKKTIEGLRGSLEIESSEGEGTTVTLKIPLTMAIIEGLLVKLGDDFFVVPLAVVRECVELSPEDASRSNGRRLVNLRGSLLPYVNLREFLAHGGESSETGHVVVIDAGGRGVGLLVDEVIGSLQTVIKNLGRMYQDLEGVSGATILGDGTIALILDVLKLAAIAEAEETAMSHQT